MPKAKGQRPATKADLQEFVQIIAQRFDKLEEKDDAFEKKIDTNEKNAESFRRETRQNFLEQGQKADETNQRLGIVERSLEPLDKQKRRLARENTTVAHGVSQARIGKKLRL